MAVSSDGSWISRLCWVCDPDGAVDLLRRADGLYVGSVNGEVMDEVCWSRNSDLCACTLADHEVLCTFWPGGEVVGQRPVDQHVVGDKRDDLLHGQCKLGGMCWSTDDQFLAVSTWNDHAICILAASHPLLPIIAIVSQFDADYMSFDLHWSPDMSTLVAGFCHRSRPAGYVSGDHSRSSEAQHEPPAQASHDRELVLISFLPE